MNRFQTRVFGEIKTGGFSLIELIVALVLTSILAVAVLGVLRSVIRNKPKSNQVVSNLVLQQLSQDLCNAEIYRVASGRLELAGALSEDPVGTATCSWAEVQYSARKVLVDRQQRSVLYRTTKAGNSGFPNRSKQAAEPMWLGVGTIVIDSTYLDDSIQRVPKNMSAAGWKALSPSFRVVLTDEESRILHSEWIYR
ncbi:MAG: type II secretion system protein [Planctomycetota bacterium]